MEYFQKKYYKKQEESVGIYTEGSSDRKVIYQIVEIEQFQHHTKNVRIQFENDIGGSPKNILDNCIKWSRKTDFDGVICVIDRDKCIHDYTHKKRDEYITCLEKAAEKEKIILVWQEDSLEEELKKSLELKDEIRKSQVLKIVKQRSGELIKTPYYHKILDAVNTSIELRRNKN